jgi:hypothetical protein
MPTTRSGVWAAADKLCFTLLWSGVGCVPSGGGPRRWQPRGENPAIWLLALLIVAIGLPFFVVSTTSPTLQRWFARLGHHFADDPCFQYAAATWVEIVARTEPTTNAARIDIAPALLRA